MARLSTGRPSRGAGPRPRRCQRGRGRKWAWLRSQGRIYVVGGFAEGINFVAAPTGVFDDVEGYDPATDSWSIHTPMRAPRHGIGAAALLGRIYVPGGANKDGFASVDTVQTFTP